MLSRRSLLAGAGASGLLAARAARAADPIIIGVSGPLTGPNAQYGAQWKDGFDLALADGGSEIGGRPLVYQFEDSQSDPRQAVAIAQKFIGDRRVVMEMGDFSSPASMAASNIYQRAGMVQFGFTNSHPDFTKGGTYMWSTSISQSDEQPALAEFAVKGLGARKVGVVYVNSDWGRTSKDLFAPAVQKLGAEVVGAEAFMTGEQDFRPTLVRLRDAGPDLVVLIAYYADAALVVRQARDQGLKQPFLGVSSIYSPKLIELGGAAVEGVMTHSPFSPVDPRPEVQAFIKRFSAKYGREPDAFNVYAYDAMNVARAVIALAGPDRKAIREGFVKVRDVPSVIYGKITFDPETRRVNQPHYTRLMVQGGRFVPWDGKPGAA